MGQLAKEWGGGAVWNRDCNITASASIGGAPHHTCLLLAIPATCSPVLEWFKCISSVTGSYSNYPLLPAVSNTLRHKQHMARARLPLLASQPGPPLP